MPEPIGFRWLIERYGLAVTQALRIETAIGPTRATVSDGTTEHRTVQSALPAPYRAHLRDVTETGFAAGGDDGKRRGFPRIARRLRGGHICCTGK